MTHVPYKGTGPAIVDTISGQTQLLWGSIAPSTPHVKSGKLKAIAVSTMKRVEAFPDVPTVNESGLKGYDVVLWHGLIAPKNLPRPILDRVNGELNKILKNKEMQDKLAGDGVSACSARSSRSAVRFSPPNACLFWPTPSTLNRSLSQSWSRHPTLCSG